MKYRIQQQFLLLLTVLLFSFSSSEPLGTQNRLKSTIAKFIRDPVLNHASVGICVVDVDSGKIIASHNEHQALVPASTQKILTTASALLILGSEFRYETKLGYSGIIDSNGVLQGNLVITGSGDPCFGSTSIHDSLSLNKVYSKWLNELQVAGVRKINGRIIADASVFDDELIPGGWLWEDMGNYYGAGASGLTAYGSRYIVFFRPNATIGLPATVLSTDPVIPGMELINRVTTGSRGSGDQVYIYGAPYQMKRILTGTVPMGTDNFAVKGSIPDPPRFVATTFAEFLKKNDIPQELLPVSGKGRAGMDSLIQEPLNQLNTWISPPLSIIAGHTNLKSDNSFAEHLLKTLGQRAYGTGTTISGIMAIKEYWCKKDLDTLGMFLFDGSGLSPLNRITAYQLSKVLCVTAHSPVAEFFTSGLPLAGRTGSLENNFRNTPSENNLRAKSGYLNNVRAYAGYTRLQNGKLVAFTIIVNHYEGSPTSMRSKIFNLMDAITRYNP